MVFESLKLDLLSASDLDLHYAALVVFNELSTRRLGGKMGIDASGNALVVVDSPQRRVRAKTPKKVTKQEDLNEMFAGALVIGEEVDLEPVSHVAAGGAATGRKYTSMHLASCDGLYADAVPSMPTAPPLDSQESHGSVSPDPPSEARNIPPASKKGGKAKSRE